MLLNKTNLTFSLSTGLSVSFSSTTIDSIVAISPNVLQTNRPLFNVF